MKNKKVIKRGYVFINTKKYAKIKIYQIFTAENFLALGKKI